MGNALRELGRRGEARSAAREAAGLYGTLVRERPEAFGLHLASSLTALNATLDEGLGRAEALGLVEEGIGLIWPCFERAPQESSAAMTMMFELALDLSDALRRAPSAALLARGKAFRRLMGR